MRTKKARCCEACSKPLKKTLRADAKHCNPNCRVLACMMRKAEKLKEKAKARKVKQ